MENRVERREVRAGSHQVVNSVGDLFEWALGGESDKAFAVNIHGVGAQAGKTRFFLQTLSS